MDNISVFSLQYLSIIVNKITRLYPRFVNYKQKNRIIFENLNIVFILQKHRCRQNANKKADVSLFLTTHLLIFIFLTVQKPLTSSEQTLFLGLFFFRGSFVCHVGFSLAINFASGNRNTNAFVQAKFDDEAVISCVNNFAVHPCICYNHIADLNCISLFCQSLFSFLSRSERQEIHDDYQCYAVDDNQCETIHAAKQTAACCLLCTLCCCLAATGRNGSADVQQKCC